MWKDQIQCCHHRLLGTVTARLGRLLLARQILDVKFTPSRAYAGSNSPVSLNDGFCRLAGVVFLSLQLTAPHVGVEVLPAAAIDLCDLTVRRPAPTQTW